MYICMFVHTCVTAVSCFVNEATLRLLCDDSKGADECGKARAAAAAAAAGCANEKCGMPAE